jgi:hypothetical protein
MDNLERAGKELAGEFFGHFLEKKLSWKKFCQNLSIFKFLARQITTTADSVNSMR